MHYSWLTSTTLLLACAAAPAQPPQQLPQQPPAAPTQDPRLDPILTQWQSVMLQVRTLEADCTRTDLDKTAPAPQIFVGKVRFAQPNRAFLHLDRWDPVAKRIKPDEYEQVICTGTNVYNYMPQEKKVYVYPLEPKQGQVADGGILELLFNIKVNEIKKRYTIQLMNVDNYYFYLHVVPLLPEDKSRFKDARLVLRKDTFMVRELWFIDASSPTDTEVKWEITNVKTNLELDVAQFTAPALQRDWKLENVVRTDQRPVPPRIVRPAAGDKP